MILYEPTNKNEPDKSVVAELSRRLSLPAAAARILANRGIQDAAQAEAFLNPGLSQLLDPYLMPDMAQAVEIIRGALGGGRRIFLFGDYDVDGVCAVAMLYEHLIKLGGKVEYRVPNRSEGYGLNIAAVEAIAARADVLITLDCGITSRAEIARARELGLETIVTDHHQCHAELPAGPVVNAHRPDALYPFRQLCGAGVALKLIQALSGKDATQDYLECAALATVADIVPLIGENRVIVAAGLKRIELGARLGLRAMLERAGVAPKGIKATHLAFAIAPRINAAGRMGDATRAVELLTTADEARANALAAELDDENKARQGIEARIMAQALDVLEETDVVQERAILLSSPDWHQGVTGIVASRLTDRFYKPVLLFHEEGGLMTASCRSIPGVHLFEALSRFSEYFTRFGGHAQAAGLTIEKRLFGEFKRGFLEHMQTYPSDIFLPVAKYDAQMRIKDVDAPLVRALERLAPFGFGNPSPVLRVKGTATAARTMGAENTHLRFTLTDGASLPSVGFSMGGRLAEFSAAGELDVLLCAEMDAYRGDNFVRSVLRHARPDTSAPADALITRNGRVFFEMFMNDAQLETLYYQRKVKNRGKAANASPRFHYNIIDADARLEEFLHGIAGSLIVARTPEGARRALAKLDALGLRERTELCFGTVSPTNDNAYHTLLLAPDIAAFAPRHFKRVLVYDSCLTARAKRKLSAAAWAHGATFFAAEAGGCGGLLEGVSTERSVLGAYYRALRQIAASAYEYPTFDALFAAVQRYIPQPHPKQLLFALRVFDELGFIRVERAAAAVKLLVGCDAKRQLGESGVYRFIEGALGMGDVGER